MNRVWMVLLILFSSLIQVNNTSLNELQDSSIHGVVDYSEEIYEERYLINIGSPTASVSDVIRLENGSAFFLGHCQEPHWLSNPKFCQGEPKLEDYVCLGINGCLIFGMADEAGELVWVEAFEGIHSMFTLAQTSNSFLILSGIVLGEFKIGNIVNEAYTYDAEQHQDNRTFVVLKLGLDLEVQWVHSVGVGSDHAPYKHISISESGLFSYVVDTFPHTEIPGHYSFYQHGSWPMLVTLNHDGSIRYVEDLVELGVDTLIGGLEWINDELFVVLSRVNKDVAMNNGSVRTSNEFTNFGLIDSMGNWLWMSGSQCGEPDAFSKNGALGIVMAFGYEEGSCGDFLDNLDLNSGHQISSGSIVIVELLFDGNQPEWGRAQPLFGLRSASYITSHEDNFFVITWGGSSGTICLIECFETNAETFLSSGNLNGTIHGIMGLPTELRVGSDLGSGYTDEAPPVTIGEGRIEFLGQISSLNEETGWNQYQHGLITIHSDSDFDGVLDKNDLCASNFRDVLQLTIEQRSDYDNDGCYDTLEDSDDDNDGISDALDDCPLSQNANRFQPPDYDGDGCHDDAEDTDDDNDGLPDGNDFCNYGDLGWVSTETTDYDGDGCRDATEDDDDDDDGFTDSTDTCPLGVKEYLVQSTLDYDQDGCKSYVEDDDNDGDNYTNDVDAFPDNHTEWIDTDDDGFGDNIDVNDDGDLWNDTEDECPKEFGLANLSGIGCVDSDQDGHSNSTDNCPMNYGTSSIDRLGCLDQDGDGLSDLNDLDPYDPSIGVAEYDGPRLDTDDVSSSSNDGNGTTALAILVVFMSSLIAFLAFKRLKSTGDDDADENVNEEYYSQSSDDENQEVSEDTSPNFDVIGQAHESGYEVLEYPSGSEKWWWKDEENQCWVPWE